MLTNCFDGFLRCELAGDGTLPMAATAQINRDSDVKVPGKAAGPCVFVLFGAAGDLTKRKLVPALYNLVRAKLLPDNFALMGVSVDDLSVEVEAEDNGKVTWKERPKPNTNWSHSHPK